VALEIIRDLIPDYAKDIRLNLSAVADDLSLTEQQKWGAILAAAHACGVRSLIQAVEAEAPLRPEACSAAKAASALMAMNNVYFRALHLMENQEYRTLRAGLRMNLLANPGVERGDYEFWAFVVSAIHGCGACLDSHEEELRALGWSASQIQIGIKIAAIVHATATVLRAEGL